jgi:hypothetical protein
MSVTESFRITELMIDVGPLTRVLGSEPSPGRKGVEECENDTECNNTECDFNCTDPGSACNDGTGGDCPDDTCIAPTDDDCGDAQTGCGACNSNEDTQAGLPAGAAAGYGTHVIDPPELAVMRKVLAEALARRDS